LVFFAYADGKWGFDSYSHLKACLEVSSKKGQMDGMGPPYNLKVLDLVRFVIRWTAPSRSVKPKGSFLTSPTGMSLVALVAAAAYYVAKVRA
jgi:hypothetical protein